MQGKRAQAVIFGLDGTLYHLKKARGVVKRRLIRHVLSHPWQWRDLTVIQAFRRDREVMAEQGVRGVGTLQYRRTALALGRPQDEVRAVVTRWLHKEPLSVLAACKSPGVDELWEALGKLGKRIAVVSDYPVTDKLAALGLKPEVAVSAEDPEVGIFKPHPAGFLRAARLLGLDPALCLVIGDRPERDGAAALAAGMDHLIYTAGSPAGAGQFASFYDLLSKMRERRPGNGL